MGRHDGAQRDLTDHQRRRLAAFRETESLAELAELVDADSEHEAYFRGKDEWAALRAVEIAAEPERDGLPGTAVTVDGREFVVHGITHADTPTERECVRSFEAGLDPARATVYCEQGIRSMYFADRDQVQEMDDYRWAMAACRDLDGETHLEPLLARSVEGISEGIEEVTSALRNAVFSLIDQYGGADDSQVKATLGALASTFLTSHEDLATGDDFEAFQKTRDAAADPSRLRDLQDYYRRIFLPQPLEREWLRRHDPELEIMTHARNQRMAEFAVADSEGIPEVHLVVGAAHQSGVAYYLRRIRDGEHSLSDFDPIP